MKRLLFAIGSFALVALLGITMVGRSGADAQDPATPVVGGSTSTDTTTDSPKETYFATLAEQLGISQEDLQTAIDATNAELGVDGSIIGGMRGPGNMHRGGSNGGESHNSGMGGMTGPTGASVLRGIDTADAATFLGITEVELKTDLLNGKSFLAIAVAHGKTIDDVRAFLIEQATADIDENLQEAQDAPAGSEATEEAGSDTTSISEPTEVPAAPAITPTATATA